MAKGTKTCKQCGATIRGPRKKVCDSCGAVLIQSMKYNTNGETKPVQESIKAEDGTVNNPPTKRPVGRPKKDDKDLKYPRQPRQPRQPKTKTEQPHNLKDFDWHTLEKGDIIKVSPHEGSSWTTDEGQQIVMGDNGNFKVISHDANSIMCWGLSKKSGTYMIWMGPETKTESGLVRKPHKILKVKKFVKQVDEEDN